LDLAFFLVNAYQQTLASEWKPTDKREEKLKDMFFIDVWQVKYTCKVRTAPMFPKTSAANPDAKVAKQFSKEVQISRF